MQDSVALKKNNGLGGVSKIITTLKSNPLLLAFVLNLLAFLFRIIVFDVKYEVSDDYITDAVLSGAFGNGYDPDLLFGNIILGYVLVFLYKLIPVVSFYFVLLILLGFISSTIVLYLLFKHRINVITLCIAVVYLSFTADDLYVLVQFTKVAAAAGIAGGLFILYGLWEAEKKKAWYIVPGALLIIVGSMVRYGPLYVYGAFLVLAFVYNAVSYVLNNRKDKSIKSIVFDIFWRFVVCLVVIGMVYGLSSLNDYLRTSNEEYRKFHEYSNLRCSITDTTIPQYTAIKDDYEDLNLNLTDYVMLNSWNFNDSDVYPDDLLEKVADINAKYVTDRTPTISETFDRILARAELFYPAAYALYIPALLALVLSRKKIYPVVLVLSAVAMFFGFFYFGRTVYRVEWGVLFCAASCMLAGFSYNDECKMAKLKKSIKGKQMSTFGFYTSILVVLLLVIRIPRITSRFDYMALSAEEYRQSYMDTLYHSGDYIVGKYGFPTSARKLAPNLIDMMESDTEHYYIVDFGTGIQDLYYNYDPWIRPEQGLFCKYSYYGGCTMHHPGERYALAQNGLDPDNPYKNLLNDNVYLVDNWAFDYKLDYIRRYYNSDAQMMIVDQIDGYYVWDIYIPDYTETIEN